MMQIPRKPYLIMGLKPQNTPTIGPPTVQVVIPKMDKNLFFGSLSKLYKWVTLQTPFRLKSGQHLNKYPFDGISMTDWHIDENLKNLKSSVSQADVILIIQ